MKGNIAVRLMGLMVIAPILIAHLVGQVDLFSPSWLWISLFAGVMGLQATYTGFCPAGMLSKLSKTGECCPGGSCGSQPKQQAAKQEVAKQQSKACCDNNDTPSEKTNQACCSGDDTKTSCCAEESVAVNQAESYHILVLGTGCANCKNAYNQVEKVTQELGLSVQLEKVEDIAEIAKYGVMTTPSVVVNGQVVHSGGVPSASMIKAWFKTD